MNEHQAKELIRKYQEGSLTEKEKAVLESWYIEFAKSQNPSSVSKDDLERNLAEIWQMLPVSGFAAERKLDTRRRLWSRVSAAASVLIVCMIGSYFYFTKNTHEPVSHSAYGVDILPGDNRAILTLADGSRIALDQAKVGNLAKEGLTAITKAKDGVIVYNAGHLPVDSKNLSSPRYNVLSTPLAGQYRVKLPDGTDVWLNALSSIRFPTVFSAKERVVEITGEVYFEVAKVMDKGKRVPFKVATGNQIVEVLGTHFNVNSYNDEETIKTTLLEGSIKINITKKIGESMLLKPGQQVWVKAGDQGNLSSSKQSFIVKEVDTQSVVAWKDGYFRFNGIGLSELMRQVSRWYGIEVVYEVPVKEYEFVGQIERSANLSKVLKILELGDVHFRIEGKKLIIME